MKKYLFSALALPLLFACSTDDFEKPVASNDSYPGIAKVNATFSLDEGQVTRMATDWDIEPNDKFGFAWLGTVTEEEAEEAEGAFVTIDGNAYQNHPLIVTDDPERGRIFKPQTSIYVGKYYLYAPYDEETVSPQAINFNSLKEQTVIKGKASGWSGLAKKAILIGDKWTEVTPNGQDVDNDGKTWNQAGIDHPFKIYSSFFSNQTALDLTYEKNNPSFAGAERAISGATDISFTLGANDEVGAADIYTGTVQLEGAASSFTYAPTVEPITLDNNAVDHSGEFWADKSGAADGGIVTAVNGFTFPAEAEPIALTFNNPDGTNGVSTGANGSQGWFWFNSLPVTAGDATLNTLVTTILETSYGTVTVKTGDNYDQNVTLGNCAYAYNEGDDTWYKLADQNSAVLSYWTIAGHNTFVNQYGNHAGKYALKVDFSKAVMNGMHIKDDRHLQKALKYYLASGKNEAVTLILDGATDKTFKLSKISIALLQTINKNAQNKVLVKACDIEDHNAPRDGKVKIVVTQDGQTGDLEGKSEVPALNDVFAEATPVYLASNTEWTWNGEIGGQMEVAEDGTGILPIDANVISITNEGILNVTNENVQLSIPYQAAVAAQEATQTTEAIPATPAKYYLVNAAIGTEGAEMNFTAVTTVKNPLTNFGVINIAEGAELRAYDVEVINDATSLTAFGRINNSGVIGTTFNTNGVVSNYGLITMENEDAMTLLTRNQTANANTSFKNEFNAETNKLGTVILPNNNPIAIVSVSNAPETGFIKYRWPADAGNVYETPAGIVKYNTVIVSDDIAIADVESELKYIEFDNSDKRISFTNPDKVNGETAVYLPSLKGIIVTNDTKVLLEKTNKIVCGESAYLGTGATIYNGGKFTMANAIVDDATKVVTNYLGEWSTNQIVKW